MHLYLICGIEKGQQVCSDVTINGQISLASKLIAEIYNLVDFYFGISASSGGFEPSHCHFVSLGKTLNSQCLLWAEEFHQYIIAIYRGDIPKLYTIIGICGMVPDQWVFAWYSGFLTLLSGN